MLIIYPEWGFDIIFPIQDGFPQMSTLDIHSEDYSIIITHSCYLSKEYLRVLLLIVSVIPENCTYRAVHTKQIMVVI